MAKYRSGLFYSEDENAYDLNYSEFGSNFSAFPDTNFNDTIFSSLTADFSEFYFEDESSSFVDDSSGTSEIYELTPDTVAAALPTFTLGQISDYLSEGYWGDRGTDSRSFNFTDSSASGYKAGRTLHYNYSGFTDFRSETDADGLTAPRRALVDLALEYIGEILDINFVLTTSTSESVVDLLFHDNESGAHASTFTYAAVNGHKNTAFSMINIAESWSGGTSDVNDYTYQTLIHEVFHALGLGHGGNYNGNANYVTDTTDPDYQNNSNHYLNDSWQQTIMSYFDPIENTNVNADYNFVITGMAADWIALGNHYGTSAFTGDTIYGFNTNISTSVSQVMADLSLYADKNMFTIIDDGGVDTLDFSGYAQNQNINMTVALASSTTGSVSDIGGETGNMTLAIGTVIENATGGSGNDVFTLNDASNVIRGGDGTDRAIFDGASTDYTFSNTGSIDGLTITGDGTDTFYSIEQFTFTDGTFAWDNLPSPSGTFTEGDDVHTATSASDTLDALGGNDTVYGEGGMDTIYGRAGADMLYGGADNDILYGGADNDRLFGNAGADELYGGDGYDVADYSSSDAAIIVRLWNGTGEGGTAQGDTLDSIEGVVGSGFNDTLIGRNSQNDNLYGGAGSDFLYGLSGDDYIEGGADDDFISGGAGADTLDGGEGFDTADYSGSAAAVTIRLWNGTGEGGDAQGDMLSGIEGIIGSALNDTLIGRNNESNTLNGGDGNDQIYALSGDDTLIGGLGSDTLNGGDGTDTADYSASSASVLVRLWNGTGSGGDAEGDSLAEIENVTGSNFADTLIGANGVANSLSGGEGSDFLYGLTGADTLMGGAGDDILVGGADADVLDGGEGTDLADYSDSASGVTVRLWNGTGESGDAQGDTLTSIEDVNGTAFGDTIVGSSASANRLDGGAGNDFLYGLGGDDVLIGGAGADVLDGGAGSDSVDYSGSSAAVLIRLWNGSGEGGDAQGDTLSSIEAVTGSAFNDTLIGDYDSSDQLNGGDGNDNLYGLSGDDTLSGGTGDDILVGGSGADMMDGGAGTDMADYSASGSAVSIRLWNGTGEGGNAQGDVLSGIENVTGSAFSDLLIGANSSDNHLKGGEGNDSLYGLNGADRLNGGTGNDLLSGGDGADTFEYQLGEGADTVSDFNAAEDTLAFYGLDPNVTAQDILNMASDQSGDVLIDLGNGSTLTLTGVSVSDLSTGNISVSQNAAARNDGIFKDETFQQNSDSIAAPLSNNETDVSVTDVQSDNFDFSKDVTASNAKVSEDVSAIEPAEQEALLAEFISDEAYFNHQADIYYMNAFGVLAIVTPDDADYWDMAV